MTILKSIYGLQVKWSIELTQPRRLDCHRCLNEALMPSAELSEAKSNFLLISR
jgi:hypothetical protein